MRPFYWSVRRELWENRSLFIAPLVAAGIVLLALILRAMHLPQDMQTLSGAPAGGSNAHWSLSRMPLSPTPCRS